MKKGVCQNFNFGNTNVMARSFLIVGAILATVVLIVVVPMVTTADRAEQISSELVQQAVSETVDSVSGTGTFSMDDYEKLSSKLATTGNKYNIELKALILDENYVKKTTQTEYSKIGENLYVTEYSPQVLEKMEKSDFELAEGDIFSITATLESTSLSQQLRNFLYTISGNDESNVIAHDSAMVGQTANN